MPTLYGDETALLVIDVQHALFQRASPVYNADKLLQRLNTLMDRAHQAETPVILFQHMNKGVLKKNSKGWMLHPDLNFLDVDTFMEKRHGSAFQETLLDDWLRSRGITTLVLCGLTTHGCIKATCKDALEHGYQTILSADAHSSYHADAASLIHQWNSRLGQQGAIVAQTKTILFQPHRSPMGEKIPSIQTLSTDSVRRSP